jgi:hypothetical protein
MIALAAWARDRIVVVAGETWVRYAVGAHGEAWRCHPRRGGCVVASSDGVWRRVMGRLDEVYGTRDEAMRAAVRGSR